MDRELRRLEKLARKGDLRAKQLLEELMQDFYRANPDDEEAALQQLLALEDDYWDSPAFIRKQDLKTINNLRQQLGMLLVDANLNEIEPVSDEETEVEEIEDLPPPPPPDPHAFAREVYNRYQDKIKTLAPHRDYANRLIRATASNPHGMTPVMPLAIMGTGRGPIRCDYCEKQFPLEGGMYNNVIAGAAWQQEQQRLGHAPRNWHSFIHGHVTFMIVDNGTFRAYHGFPDSGCGGNAMRQMATEEEKFLKSGQRVVPSHFRKAIHEFLQDERGMFGMKKERDELIQAIIREFYAYDPGIGINRPDI